MTGPETHPPHVEVWQQADGKWRWRYVAQVGDERVVLPSNEPASTCEEAVHKGAIAYPGLPIEITEAPRGDSGDARGPTGRRRRRFLRPGPALLAGGLVLLGVLHPRRWTTWPAAVALAVMVHRLRRR